MSEQIKQEEQGEKQETLIQRLSEKLRYMRRRWRRIAREKRAKRFPESNRALVQALLFFSSMLPVMGCRVREKVLGRHRQAANRETRFPMKRLHTAAYFGLAGVAAAVFLFFSFYTVGLTVSYDGQVVGQVASRSEVTSACEKLEEVTQKTLGENYTIDENKLEYATSLVPRQDVVDGKTLETELSSEIGAVSYGYALYVDGELVGATPYEGALEELLLQMKDSVTDENTLSCGFQEDISIKAGYVPSDKVMNLGYLAEMLSNTKQEEITYTIQGGDTWSEIAEKSGMTSDTLLALNPGYDVNKITAGDVLTVSTAVPYLTLTVTEKETYTEPIPYEIEYVDSEELFKGETSVLSKGRNGSAVVNAKVTYVNGEETAREVISTKTVVEAVTEQQARGTKERPTWIASGEFHWPCTGNITSRFGYRNLSYSYASKYHKGIDIANRAGTPICAADGGTVVYAGWMSGYGYLVEIDHGNGYTTYYGHNSSLMVSVGDHVYQGQQIAAMGSTGNSTGNHCHFEVRLNGEPKNPLNFLP